jgi:integrase
MAILANIFRFTSLSSLSKAKTIRSSKRYAQAKLYLVGFLLADGSSSQPTALTCFLPILTALSTRMPQGEILAIRWSDLILEYPRLTVN